MPALLTPLFNIEYKVLAMPLSQIPTLNPLAPAVVQFRFSGGVYGGNNYCLAGFIDAAENSLAWQSSARSSQQLVGVGSAGANNLSWAAGTSGPSSFSISSPWSSPPTGHAFSVYRASQYGALTGHGLYSGGFPDPYTLTSGFGNISVTSLASNLCIGIVFNCQSAFSAYVMNMKIWQPKF